jgi:predicted helicase
MARNPYQTYFKDIKNNYGGGTEFTYRTYFENLLNEIKPDKDIKVIQEPPKDEDISGRPDFKIERNGLVVGYIETKPLGMNLDEIVKGNSSRESQQLKRYLKVSPNLIITNYNEFILFKNGIPVDRNVLFFPSTDRKLNSSNVSNLEKLFTSFFNFSSEVIVSSEKLSYLLAERTKLFRDFLKELLDTDDENDYKERLFGLKDVLQNTLIEDLSYDDFIDAYAQTITYGLFLAEINSKEKISEEDAYKYIPKSMGIIRELFKTIDIEDIPDNIEWILEDIIDLLNRVDRKKLKINLSFSELYDYEDPYVYFYENFLRAYDQSISVKRGVYYTPIPVVNFIVKSINHLLKENFNSEGLKGEDIKVLDFATGTGTFILEAFDIALKDTDEGMKEGLIHERLLKNYYGFEYLIAPYTIAHLKLSQYLEEAGSPLNDKERFKIYLTDTLDRYEHKGLDRYFSKLTKEGIEANIIKTKENILVMMGNPPYNSKSKNNKEWILKLIETYKKCLNEKNMQPLNNDYVKFIRYAHWKIEQNGKGIIGIITSNSYLDGLVHRVMRKELLKTFDKLYILNLHGNSRKNEPDENVFDIQEGVSIVLFVKLQEPLDEKEVYYYSTLDNKMMDREIKYGVLLANDVSSIPWVRIKPSEPDYWFIKKDLTLQKEYDEFWGLTDIFNEYNSGIQTRRDNFTLHHSKNSLKIVIKDLIDLDVEKIRQKYNLPADGRDWKVEKAKNDVIEDLKEILNHEFKIAKDLNDSDWEIIESKRIKKIHYRPFDYRFTYYFNKSRSFIGYPTYNTSKQFILGKNLGIVSVRQFAENKLFSHAFISDKIIDMRITSSNRGTAYVFPLFLYEGNNKSKLISLTDSDELVENPLYYKNSNFKEDFKSFISTKYPDMPPSEDILSYIYAILYSNKYRKKYNEFLKTDFPRIPFTKDINRFKLLAKLGTNLIDTHLLKNDYYDSELALYLIEGDNRVDKIKYDEENSRLYINKEQYFENVPKEVWNMEIGGYKVIDKWLKYRKKDGIKLSYTNITHLQKVITALNESISIISEIDQVYKKIRS